MADRNGADEGVPGLFGIAGLSQLPHASSLMSSRWSRDNLVTSDPQRLYDGAVEATITAEMLEPLLAELETTEGPIQMGAARMGVFTWDISCEGLRGPFVVQIPRVLDRPGRLGRSKGELPHESVRNVEHFLSKGLCRYVNPALATHIVGGRVQAALLDALPHHHPLTFGSGALLVDLYEGERSWVVSLSPETTAELLAELIACLVYHYDPDVEGGTAVTDVFINDGDFVVRKKQDGSFDLRLTTVRKRQGGISPELFLLYLVQLMGYEDWEIDGRLTGLPVLISNPSVTFEGVTRGLRYRAKDLGLSEESGSQRARAWVKAFGRSREGTSYRPWVDSYLKGELPLSFGEDPRERWWRRIPLQTKQGLLELQARHTGSPDQALSARTIGSFVDTLGREIGRGPAPAPGLWNLNALDRAATLALLKSSRVPLAQQKALTDEICLHWPYRSFDHLLEKVPGADALRHQKRRLSWGHVLSDETQATPAALSVPTEPRDKRPVANHELYSALELDPTQHELATKTFPTFEAYMDASLHDETWGYYSHHVEIGTSGHFSTNPETLSPHYGRWLARWAFKVWQDMLAQGELAESDAFPVVEFGAGNGRLARDLLDALPTLSQEAEPTLQASWVSFSQRVEYRIYEVSSSLRERQQALLGADALVLKGDARSPGEALARDFPQGLRGFVVTNELPDAFGFHKVLLTRDARALVALVVPRIEGPLLHALPSRLSEQLRSRSVELRNSFSLSSHRKETYLDQEGFDEVMRCLAKLPTDERELLSTHLQFEETYLPVRNVPDVGDHLKDNASQYATALAKEDSGVVVYLNLHANDFIQGLGSALRAGVIVTIDYGNTTWGLVQGARMGDFPFRVYGQQDEYRPRPNDPYTAPGLQDLTADVNFTDLAQAGRNVGLEVLYFGWERDVAGDELPQLLSESTEPAQATFLGNPVFKFLVQGPRKSAAFEGPLLTPLPLQMGGGDVPKSKRRKLAPLQAALSSLGSEHSTSIDF